MTQPLPTSELPFICMRCGHEQTEQLPYVYALKSDGSVPYTARSWHGICAKCVEIAKQWGWTPPQEVEQFLRALDKQEGITWSWE